eukprot:363322-Chlamydomonas_euryale.AAC.3
MYLRAGATGGRPCMPTTRLRHPQHHAASTFPNPVLRNERAILHNRGPCMLQNPAQRRRDVFRPAAAMFAAYGTYSALCLIQSTFHVRVQGPIAVGVL